LYTPPVKPRKCGAPEAIFTDVEGETHNWD
jgi:hypothetical protein